MGSADGVKGNKKGSIVKSAGLAITICLSFFAIVLVLDAYKFVSVRVSENEGVRWDDSKCFLLH